MGRSQAQSSSMTVNRLVRAADSSSIDAFSRWRVSNPVTLFDSMSQYGDNTLQWETAVVGTGAVSNNLADASVHLSTGGTASGAKATRQTIVYFRYQPGKSQLVLVTGNMQTAYTNVRFREGYFDDDNGIFLERSGTAVTIVRRSKATGVVVDTPVAQAAWNMDKLNGSGPSGLTLDLTKAQILIIDLQWLGVGRVRVGFDINGVIIYVHEFLNANNLTQVYMSSACLPVRYSVENTGAASGTGVFKTICAAVLSEGGFEAVRGIQFDTNRAGTPLTVTARRPVISLQAKTTGPNGVRNIGHILPRSFEVYSAANSCLVEIVRGGALTGAAWTAVDATYSIAEKDTSATAITGGRTISSFYVATAGVGQKAATAGSDPFEERPLVYSGLNGTREVLSIVITPISGNPDINASIAWQELY